MTKEYKGINLFTVYYKMYKYAKKRSKAFKTLEDAKNFKNEIIAKGFEVVSVYNYIGKKIEI